MRTNSCIVCVLYHPTFGERGREPIPAPLPFLIRRNWLIQNACVQETVVEPGHGPIPAIVDQSATLSSQST